MFSTLPEAPVETAPVLEDTLAAIDLAPVPTSANAAISFDTVARLLY
jgi:hypothetical protein